MPESARAQTRPHSLPAFGGLVEHLNDNGWRYCLLLILLFAVAIRMPAQDRTAAHAAPPTPSAPAL